MEWGVRGGISLCEMRFLSLNEKLHSPERGNEETYRGRRRPRVGVGSAPGMPASDCPGVLRYSRGVMPATCLNARLNRLRDSNPES